MNLSVQNFLLYYKSRLFDLMEAPKDKRITEWISILVECLEVRKAVFYKRKKEINNQLCLEYTYSNEEIEYPNCINKEIIQSLFSESNYVDRIKLAEYPMLFKGFNSAFNFIYKGQEVGCLFLCSNEDSLNKYIAPHQTSFIYESGKFISILESISCIVEEEKKFKELFRVTETFHDSMDVDAILYEIINTLRRVFPHFTYTLLLSNDTKHDKNLPIKEIQFDDADEAVMKSFLNGETNIVEKPQQKTMLYAPLSGKQGVYGVLQVVTFSSFVFQNSEVEFIRLLANTGGSALENAKLYEQSQRLVEDLQLINETSHRLNSSARLDETLHFLNSQILKSFHTNITGYFLLNEEKRTILDGSHDFFTTSQGKAYLDFVTDVMMKRKESIIFSNVKKQMEHLSPYSSLMAVPMIEGETIKGFCVVLNEQPYYFTFDMFKLFQSLIHHSTLAVTNSMLREELEKMVITDHLTQLYAKNYLNDTIQRSMENDEEGTFLLLDIDNFKVVNDTYGHQIGDEILIQVAKLINQNIRQTDIGARWGGEELAIYLPGAPLEVGARVANRLVKAVYENTNPQVTISCGVSYWTRNREDQVPNLFNRADIGLYLAKELGKNQVVVQEVGNK
ncbi:hypothetical protein BLX88_18240 [Bacillus obstructivus]|nr:hypothetical protein BLX88_18240 [Bacillus obstructivus]